MIDGGIRVFDGSPPEFLVSVVIPVYNEHRWLAEVVRRVQAVPVPKEIIIVDELQH
jgi:cellulose synthase/poly-beta-1,6-N-acetylglucosamine synthase-like glycosyltransferase